MVAVSQARLHAGQVRPVGEVGDEHLDVDLVGAAQVLSHLLETGRVPGDQDEVVVARGEHAASISGRPHCSTDPVRHNGR